MKSKFRFDIQVIRGLALVSVLLYHAKPNYFPLGFLGVDVFFVVSGFVVTPLILDIFAHGHSWNLSRPRFLEFYKRRFLRLAPALSASILFSMILIFLLGPIQDHRRISFQALFSLLGIGNLGAIYFSGDYFSPHPNAFVHTWSLSVEEQIYFAIPIFLLLSMKFLPKRFKSIRFVYASLTVFSITLFLMPVLLHPLYEALFGANGDQFEFYSPITRIWQFTLGGLAYFAGSKLQIKGHGVARISKVLVSAGLFSLLFNPFIGESVSLVVLVTVLSVLAILFRAGDYLPTWLMSLLGWLGNRSYSIYLLHLPLIYLAKYSPEFGDTGVQSRIWQTIVAVIASIALGSVFYSQIENRFRKTSHNRNVVNVSRIRALSFVVVPVLTLLVLIISPYRSYLGDPNLPSSSSVIPWEIDINCQVLKDDSAANQQPCNYPASGKESILLFGDSHAASYSETFRDIARRYDLDLYVSTYSDCPFLLSLDGYAEMGNVPYFSTSCLRHNQELLRFIESKQIQTAFYAQRARAEDGDSQIVDSLLKLKGLNTNVVVLGMNPEYIPVSTVLGNITNRRGSFSSKVKLVNENWQKITSDKSLRYIDVYSAICPNSICRTRDGSDFLYFDDNHLSNFGSSLVRPQIEASLNLSAS